MDLLVEPAGQRACDLLGARPWIPALPCELPFNRACDREVLGVWAAWGKHG